MVSILKKNMPANLSLVFFIVLLAIYRFYWIELAYWGVDEATNLWLGYVKPISKLNIGLISSQLIPNPNGMMIVGKFLSIFGSAVNISLFLTLLNLYVLYLFLLSYFIQKNFDFYLIFLIGGSSILISSTAIEFWNQWILLTINLMIMTFVFRYINSNKVINLYILIFLIPLPVFIYLGGLTNTLAFGIIFLYLIYKTHKQTNINFLPLSFYTLFVAIIYWIFTFQKFFNTISLNRLGSLNSLSIIDRAKYLLNNLLKLPDGLINTWNKKEKFVIFQTDSVILNSSTEQLLEIFFQFHKILPLFTTTLFFYCLTTALRNGEKSNNQSNNKKTNLLVFFISFSLVMSPIYGGPDFLIIQEKSNNLNQYYLFFILIWYLLPFSFNNTEKSKNILLLNRSLFTIFFVLNLILGIQIIKDNKSFDSNIKTSIEAPLKDKIDVVDFIANEWIGDNNSNSPSIEYNIFVSEMTWFNGLTNEFSRYYNPSPYTEGRVLDYELLIRYNLMNMYNQNIEPDFIVTNLFEPEPQLKDKILNHYKVGRLRVTKVDK
jgi:hypothetical protein